MAGDLHGDLPVHPGSDQVADSGAAEIVEELAAEPGSGAGGCPRLAEFVDARTVAVEDQPAVQATGGQPALEDRLERPRENERPRLLGLGGSGGEGERAGLAVEGRPL